MRISKSIIAYKRKHPNCEACFKPTIAWPHHIRSRGAGGSDKPENLLALCAKCHHAIHFLGPHRFVRNFPHLKNKIERWHPKKSCAKGIILTIFFLLIVTGANAEFFGSGEFGYCRENEDYYTELEIGYRFHPWILELELYGGIEVLMEKSDGMFFSPYRDTYIAGGILQCRFLYLTIEHMCIHSVYSNKEQFEEKYTPGSGQTRFGIGFEF